MSVFKYVTCEGGLRFLRTWSLRITPPGDFNDPFELKPPIAQLMSETYAQKLFDAEVPRMLLDQMAEEVQRRLGGLLNDEESRRFAGALLGTPSPTEQKNLVRVLSQRIPGFSAQHLVSIQQQFRLMLPTLIEQAREQVRQMLPTFNEAARSALSERAPTLLGVLCLSRNGNQPLMWSHYADSHRGLMLEFDEYHPAFNRMRGPDDELGYLRAVVYSGKRPQLSMESIEGDRAWEVFALTKAAQWSYEEEVRLIWPLKHADRTVETPTGEICLLSFPPECLLSITFGCKTSDSDIEQIRRVIEGQPEASKVILKRACLDEMEFELRYQTLPKA